MDPQELAELQELEELEQLEALEKQQLQNEIPADTSHLRTILDQGMQGATFGFADEVSDRIGALIASRLTGESYEDLLKLARASSKNRMEKQTEERPLLSIGSNLVGGLLTGGALTAPKNVGTVANLANNTSKLGRVVEAVRGAINAIPEAGSAINNWTRAGNVAARTAKLAATGVPATALYGAGTAEDGKKLEGATNMAPFGLIPAALPALSYAGSKAKNLIAPKIEDEAARMAKIAMEKYGIPLSRSQVGSNKSNKLLASVAERTPFAFGQGLRDHQQTAFNRAIAKAIGADDADSLTPAVMEQARKNIGNKFDEALDGLTVKIDDEGILGGLSNIAESTGNISEDKKKVVERWIGKFIDQADDNGWVPAQKLGSFRSQLTDLISSKEKGDAETAEYLKKLRDVVVDASVAGDPARKDALNQARFLWKNMKTIQPLAEKSYMGNISPALLMNPTRNSFKGTYAFGGDSDLEELARIGNYFLKESIPNSGTPERMQMIAALGAPIEGGKALAALATGTALPATIPYLAGTYGGAAAYNLFNRNQPLVKKAIERTLQPQKLKGVGPLATIPATNAIIGD